MRGILEGLTKSRMKLHTCLLEAATTGTMEHVPTELKEVCTTVLDCLKSLDGWDCPDTQKELLSFAEKEIKRVVGVGFPCIYQYVRYLKATQLITLTKSLRTNGC